MFFGLENTQNEVSLELENLCKSGDLPSSLLFSGPAFSSRMYAARCVAKYYKSDETSMIILSDRDYGVRIKALLNVFKDCKEEENFGLIKIFLKQTVSEYLLQYSGALLENVSSTQKKSFTDASECSEIINTIEDVTLKDSDAFYKKLEKSLAALKIEKNSLLSVNQIRSIKTWCNTSSLENRRKVVIIEGLENTSPSCSNALLKIIEEPPRNTTFIILTENAGRIPLTILSRVRKFSFTPFSDIETRYILSLTGAETENFKDLNTFFIKMSGVNYALLEENATRLANSEKINLVSLVSELDASDGYEIFFTLLSEKMRDKYRTLISKYESSLSGNSSLKKTERMEGGADYSSLSAAMQIGSLLRKTEEAVNRGKVLNQSARLTLEHVLYLFAKSGL